jgi:hypothetical protein
MAVTQNTYTGNGSTVLYSFTFPYLDESDIQVEVNGTPTTAYTLANATTIQFTSAPANGASIRIFRETDDTETKATFFPGSAIRSQDLNENFTQGLYVTQESKNTANAASSVSAAALTASQTAQADAAAAVSTSNAAASSAANAVSAANNAVTTANAATSTANSASSTANTAIATANAASAAATTATSNASAAVSTANTANNAAQSAVSAANSAVSTANAASSQAGTAVSTANTALANANTAVTTANSATNTANAASITANTADVKADAAIAAVASSVNYTGIANVAAIPASPANNTYIEVLDTTGLESFTPLAGMPVGFVGDSGLRARLRYTTSGSTWNWIDYAPTDADGRYLKKSGGTMTGALTLSGAPSSNLHAATKQYVDAVEVQAVNAQSTANTAVSNAAAAQSTANTAVSDAAAAQSTANAALPKAGGTMTGAITFAGGQTFPSSGLATASTSVAGIVQLSDSTSSTSSSTAATSAAVKAVQDFAQVVSTTATGAMPKAGGTFTGDVTFNTTTATTLPVGSTAQRPSGSTGMVRYNSTLGGFEGFSGGGWGSLGGGATGGSSDKVFVETDQTITTSYTLSAGKNAMTAGPVTVASGATVTVPSGAAWVIV